MEAGRLSLFPSFQSDSSKAFFRCGIRYSIGVGTAPANSDFFRKLLANDVDSNQLLTGNHKISPRQFHFINWRQNRGSVSARRPITV
jgi:hypothetical protein